MAENMFSILLKAILDENASAAEIKRQIDNLSKKASDVQLGVKIDDKEIERLRREIADIQKSLENDNLTTKERSRLLKEMNQLQRTLNTEARVYNQQNKQDLAHQRTQLSAIASAQKDAVSLRRSQQQLAKMENAEIEKENNNLREQKSLLSSMKTWHSKQTVGYMAQTGLFGVDDLGELKTAQSAYDQLISRIESGQISIKDARTEFQLLKDGITQLGDTVKKVDKIQHSLSVGDYDTQLKSYTTALQKAGIEGQELTTKINSAKTALDELRKSATADNLVPSDIDEKFTKLRTEFEKLANDVKNVKLDNSLFADDIKVNDTITRLNEQLRKNGAYSISARKKIEEWIRELEKGNVAEARLKSINSEAKELHSNMAKLGKIGKSGLQTFAEYVRSFSEWMISSGAVLEVVQGVKTATNNVIKLSNSLLELSKVSDLSEVGLLKVTERAYELSKTVGKTGTQVLDAVTEFKRAGYDMDKSFNMAEAAMVMTNVAENIKETSDAAGTLISVLKGFNMAETDAMKIVDMINSTSNKSPIGFDQLAEGLERTAGTLAQSGNSIQQTIGLLTAGYAQLRNVEKVSQGLITISARIRGVGEDGETIDGLASKMSEDFGKIGVAVENADGSLRSIYEIAQDYAEELPNLTDKQKQYYAELAAGKHQVTVWNAIVQQFEDAENATAQAIDSVGSASEENQKYLDSISGKISILQSAIEKLSNTVLNSKILSFFVDLGTVGVNAIDGLINSMNLLSTTLAGSALVGIGAFVKNFAWLVKGDNNFRLTYSL